MGVFQFRSYNLNIITNNVLKIGPMNELEKLLVHGLGFKQMVKLWSNWIKPGCRIRFLNNRNLLMMIFDHLQWGSIVLGTILDSTCS